MANSFAEQVQALDAFLTGKSAAHVAQTWRNQGEAHNPENWPALVYYLSDGSYSRLTFGFSGPIGLTSNSRPEVAARWEFCRELRDDVSKAIAFAVMDADELRESTWMRGHINP